MSVLIQKTNKRKKFIEKAFEWGNIKELIKDKKRILIKPNIVSSEPYPTTTHPEVLETILELLLKEKSREEILVGDGPAFNAGDSRLVIQNHPLKKVCDSFGLDLVDFNNCSKKLIRIGGKSFNIAEIVLESDFIISLPVLKVHKICMITGALKNQYGVLSPKNKLIFHLPLQNIHRAIALLNKVVKVDFWIVDAIQTLVLAQEKRHGGKTAKLGYMLAGFNPVELDIEGLNLLKKVEPRLKGLKPQDIPQIKWAIKEGLYNLFK